MSRRRLFWEALPLLSDATLDVLIAWAEAALAEQEAKDKHPESTREFVQSYACAGEPHIVE